MKRLIVTLVVTALATVLYRIGSKTFETQQVEFYVLSLLLIILYGIYGIWMATTDAEGVAAMWHRKKKRAAEKASDTPAEAKPEPETAEVKPEPETAAEIAKRNWENILAYCKEHKYHLLSDRKYLLYVPSWAQENLCSLIQQREEREILQNCGVYAYFAIEKHEIKLLVEYYISGEGRQQFYLSPGEPSELAEALLPFLIDRWLSIKAWLKEPEELLQKCLTFDPEKNE